MFETTVKVPQRGLAPGRGGRQSPSPAVLAANLAGINALTDALVAS